MALNPSHVKLAGRVSPLAQTLSSMQLYIVQPKNEESLFALSETALKSICIFAH